MYRPTRTAKSTPRLDPLTRFVEIHAALSRDLGFFSDKIPARYAAVSLLSAEGGAEELAVRVKRTDQALKDVGRKLRVRMDDVSRELMAALLARHGDPPHRFLEEVVRVRAMFRRARIRRSAEMEIVAILILRRLDLELQRVFVDELDGADGQVLPVPRISGDARQFGGDAVVVEELPLRALNGIDEVEEGAV